MTLTPFNAGRSELSKDAAEVLVLTCDGALMVGCGDEGVYAELVWLSK